MLKLKVDGMTCEHCVRAVTRALGSVPNVENVEVSLASGEVKLEGNPDASLALRAVRDQGYEASIAV